MFLLYSIFTTFFLWKLFQIFAFFKVRNNYKKYFYLNLKLTEHIFIFILFNYKHIFYSSSILELHILFLQMWYLWYKICFVNVWIPLYIRIINVINLMWPAVLLYNWPTPSICLCCVLMSESLWKIFQSIRAGVSPFFPLTLLLLSKVVPYWIVMEGLGTCNVPTPLKLSLFDGGYGSFFLSDNVTHYNICDAV